MSNIKKRLLDAITVMTETDAYNLWLYIESQYTEKNWDDIEDVEPDEFDLKMLAEIDANPDCNEFVSEDEALKMLDLQK